MPTFLNNITIDAIVAGPNVGQNLGPFLYTLSGTIGATYAAVDRGYPAIAFSGGDSVQRSYKQLNQTNPSGLPDPATIEAQISVSIVQQLVANAKGGRLLPPGYGISVNYPLITSATNKSCINPPLIQTRLTGSADVDGAVYNATTGLFTYKNIVPATGTGLNTCINGPCNLPGETAVVGAGCQASVSVFTVDYDAPTTGTTTTVRSSLLPLVQYQNTTASAKVRREFSA